LDHPDNINHPTAWWLPGNTLGAVLAAKGDIELSKDQELVLKYRLLILPAPISTEEIQTRWERFARN
jgi:hypothetical protein